MKRRVLLIFFLLSTVAQASDTVTVHGKVYYLGLVPGTVENPKRAFLNLNDVPTSYDAVAAGKATPVKDNGQGFCGDCWAWARTSSLEAAAIAAGSADETLKLSEEDTTANASDEYGCDGGMMDFNYEVQHGVTLQANCPFTEGRTGCSAAPVVKGVSMAYVGGPNGPTDEELEAAIYQYGSVAVTVAATGNFDTDSGSDRMTSCGGQAIDHMVSLVGWRPSPKGGVEFKMKNSWGHSWGKDGYAYLARGCNQLATGDQSAMAVSVTNAPPPPPPGQTKWECQARPAFGAVTYLGVGKTKPEAHSDALHNCHQHGHLICHVTTCEKTPAIEAN